MIINKDKVELSQSQLLKICYDLFIAIGIIVKIVDVKIGHDQNGNEVFKVVLENNSVIACVIEILQDVLLEFLAKTYNLEDAQGVYDNERVYEDDPKIEKENLYIMINLHNVCGSFEDEDSFDDIRWEVI